MPPDGSDGQVLARLAGAYAMLLGHLHDVAVVLFDRDLRLWQAGDQPAGRHGWGPGELQGRSLFEVLPAELAERLAGHYRAALAGERRSFDSPGFKDPTRTWSVTVAPVRDEDGGVVGGLVVAQDSSARAASDATLQAREAELRRQAELLDLAHDAVLVREPDGRITYCNREAEAVYGWAREKLLGQITHELFRTRFPDSLQAQEHALASDGWWEGELVHTRADGAELTVHSRQAMQRDGAGNPVAVIEINRDVTAQRQAEARLAERVRWLEALHQVTTTILDGSSLDASLALVARFGRVLARADLAAMTVPAGRPGQLRLHSVDGAHAERLRDAELPVAGSVAGEVFSTGQPVVLADAAADPRTSQPVVRLGLFGPAMFLPMQTRGRVFGTLTVARLSGAEQFGQDELTLVQAFADQAAMAFEFARAQREAQRAAVLEDRERIGGELHDAVIQSLFAIGLHLQGAAAMIGDAEPARRIHAAVVDLDRTMEELRRDIFGLRVGVAPDRRLERALHTLAEDLEHTSGTTLVFDIDQRTAAALGDRTAEIVGLVRAALTRPGGGGATTSRLRLHNEDGLACLVLDDDAPGPAPDARRLRPFAERLEAELEATPDPAGGMTLRARLPLPPA